MTSNLDNRLVLSINYTCRDQIICDLMNIIECPIILDISKGPILFHYQFYDRVFFDALRRGEDAKNTRATGSGYNNHRVFPKAQGQVLILSQPRCYMFTFVDVPPVLTLSRSF